MTIIYHFIFEFRVNLVSACMTTLVTTTHSTGNKKKIYIRCLISQIQFQLIMFLIECFLYQALDSSMNLQVKQHPFFNFLTLSVQIVSFSSGFFFKKILCSLGSIHVAYLAQFSHWLSFVLELGPPLILIVNLGFEGLLPSIFPVMLFSG